MSDIVISVENLSKRYLVGHNADRSEHRPDFRELISRNVSSLARKTRDVLNGRVIIEGDEVEEFWALKDVSFEVRQGERLGIIGRNGAGKSTLLKILSRITEPTRGCVRITGRVASLLEVGTGFHPEFTGRENIYLNGSLLGMTKAEIRSRFDAIVDFAEVERFLDTPVKHYSSGMYVRLAFAVAAHLESEILIADEVLAVGDAEFQRKCLGRLEEVGNEGRTVIFVSHNTSSIGRLCTSALVLENGSISTWSSNVQSAIDRHLRNSSAGSNVTVWAAEISDARNAVFTPERFYLTLANGSAVEGPVYLDTEVWVTIEGNIGTLVPDLQIGFGMFAADGVLLYHSSTLDAAAEYWPKLQNGHLKLRCRLPHGTVNEGIYRLELLVARYRKHWILRPGTANSPSISLEVIGCLSTTPYSTARRPGYLAPISIWSNERDAVS